MSKKKTAARQTPAPPLGRPFVKTTPNFADPPLWPHGPRAMTFTEKVHMLCALSPDKTQALHMLIDSVLRDEWWATARTDDGLNRLAFLVEEANR
jgi:hypothetical protein